MGNENLRAEVQHVQQADKRSEDTQTLHCRDSGRLDEDEVRAAFCSRPGADAVSAGAHKFC